MTYFSLIYISILNNLGPDHIYIYFFSCQLAERIFLNKIWHQYNSANSKHLCKTIWHASLVAQRLKRLPAMWETWVRSLGQEDPLKKEMATHSSILAWRIQWTEELGGLQSTGSQRIRHDWVTSLSLSINIQWCGAYYLAFVYEAGTLILFLKIKPTVQCQSKDPLHTVKAYSHTVCPFLGHLLWSLYVEDTGVQGSDVQFLSSQSSALSESEMALTHRTLVFFKVCNKNYNNGAHRRIYRFQNTHILF